MFIGGFFLPLFLILLFYTLIVFLLRNNEIYLTYQLRNKSTKTVYINNLYSNNEDNLIKDKKLSMSTLRNYSENLNSNQSRKKKSNYSNKEIKLVKMVCVIVLMFVIAWTPYAVVTLAAQFGSNIAAYINPYTTSLPALFAKTSSIYNPLIYTLSNKEFRQFFFNCLKKKS